eukprot:s214_g28.t1
MGDMPSAKITIPQTPARASQGPVGGGCTALAKVWLASSKVMPSDLVDRIFAELNNLQESTNLDKKFVGDLLKHSMADPEIMPGAPVAASKAPSNPKAPVLNLIGAVERVVGGLRKSAAAATAPGPAAAAPAGAPAPAS